MPGEQVTQDDVLLRAVEQARRWVAAQGRLGAQHAEAERLPGARERLRRRAAQARGDLLAQRGSGAAARGQDEARVGAQPLLPHGVDDELDGEGRLAGPGPAEDPEHPCGRVEGGLLAVVEPHPRGGEGRSATEDDHRRIPSRPTDTRANRGRVPSLPQQCRRATDAVCRAAAREAPLGPAGAGRDHLQTKGPGRHTPSRAPPPASGRSLHVEAVGLHDVRPGRDEVVDELLVGVVARVDLGEGAQLGVGAEEQVDAAAGPRLLARGVGRGELVGGLVVGGPRRAELEQVDEEVVASACPARSVSTPVVEPPVLAPRTRRPPTRTVICGAERPSRLARSTRRYSAGHAARLAEVVAEAVVLRLEVAERLDVGLLLRGVDAAGAEGHLDGDAACGSSLLDRDVAAEDDEVGERDGARHRGR